MAESKLDDWFVAKYLIHDGETVEEAKARLKAEQVRQEAVYKETAEKRRAKSKKRSKDRHGGGHCQEISVIFRPQK